MISVAIAMGISNTGFISAGLSGLCPDGRQTGSNRIDKKPACNEVPEKRVIGNLPA